MNKRKRKNTPFSLFSFQDIITGLCGIVIFLVIIMLIDIIENRNVEDFENTESNLNILIDTDILIDEIGKLRQELELLKEKNKNIIVNSKDEAPLEVQAEIQKEITEKEQEILAIYSQIEILKHKLQETKAINEAKEKNIKEMEETKRLLETKLSALKSEKWITLIPERGEAKEPIYLILSNDEVEILRPIKGNKSKKKYSFITQKKLLQKEILNYDITINSFVILVRPSGANIMKEVVEMISKFGFTYGRDPLEEDVEITVSDSLESN